MLRRMIRKMLSSMKGEATDIILIDRPNAQLSGQKTRKHIEGHRRPLTVQQSGYAH